MFFTTVISSWGSVQSHAYNIPMDFWDFYYNLCNNNIRFAENINIGNSK